jgi:hypothetical protein
VVASSTLPPAVPRRVPCPPAWPRTRQDKDDKARDDKAKDKDRNKKVSIEITGGVVTAINQCVNDATDGVIQDQQNACTQVASAGNLVTVGDITVFTRKKVSVEVTGGVATAINQCVNDATDGVIQDQQNACTQVASAGNLVSLESIAVFTTKQVSVRVDDGVATAINQCVNDATDGVIQNQQNACTQAAAAQGIVTALLTG